jgi:anti-sigma factor RsiW
MNCEDLLTVAPLYLSGELDAAWLEEVRAHLEICPQCAAEMASQVSADARLRDEVLAETNDSTALNRRIHQSIMIRRWLPVAAGIAAMLVLGFLGSLYRTSVGVSRTYSDAARDHHREVVEQQPRTWLSDRVALEALAAHQGLLPSAVVQLSQAGYSLQRGKLCRLDGRIYLHMVYSRDGQEFSIFLRQRGDPFPKDVRNSDRGDEHVASFQTDLVAGMVVTSQSSEAARHLAHVAAGLL